MASAPDTTTTTRPQCGSGGLAKDYNVGLHVFALVLILVLSFLACAFPIAARKIPSVPVPRRALFLSRHFGTGVLLATAFVHLLPTAFTSLTDPCLAPFWNEGYPAMAGFIAMISVFVVVGIEMFFASKGMGHSHDHGLGEEGQRGKRRGTLERQASYRRFQGEGWTGEGPSREQGADKEWEQRRENGEREDEDEDLELEELDKRVNGHGEGVSLTRGGPAREVAREEALEHGQAKSLTELQAQERALLQCLLLEAGILFHSVFIGMAVSVATGAAFVVLLIAICFHQTFEGLALGSRIAAITVFPKGSIKPWMMALAYGTTTPAGQLIGLVVHNLYDPQSQMGLLMVGIMNAISSGLLLFAGLVELLAEDFLAEKSYETLRGARRIEACAAVVVGSMLMAFIGAFA